VALVEGDPARLPLDTIRRELGKLPPGARVAQDGDEPPILPGQALQVLNDPADATVGLQLVMPIASAALAEAKSSALPNAFLTVHRIANDAGNLDLAEQALVEAIRLGRGPLPLYADLKPLLGALAVQGRENVLMEICAIYLAFEPGNPVLLTQYAYLACLNGIADPETIIKALEPLAKGFPKEVPIQSVLATAYLCAGQPAKAAETLDPLNLEPEKLPPSYRAAWLTTQVLNGRIPPNDPRIAEFPWKSLQPSERRKFTALIQSASP